MKVSDTHSPPGLHNPPVARLAADVVYQFGNFRLYPSRQRLLDGDNAIRLGSRALELLTMLVEQAGTLVDKGALMERGWPDTVVEEINLRVQIAALRKALGDVEGIGRLIATAPGRGYTFTAPVTVIDDAPAQIPTAAPELPPHHIPRRTGRIFGREQAIAAIVDQLPQRGFITIVGPGGMGKTTLAVAVAEQLLPHLPDGAFFVDLAPISEADAVPSAIVSAMQLTLSGPMQLERLAAQLTGRAMLVVLDNCEHLADSAAAAAETLLRASPDLWVLATSREPLRAEGEWLHRVQPLGLPGSDVSLLLATAAEAMRWPAVQLFVERATACLDSFTLTDTDAPLALALCRELDGMPLAIELAAARVDTLGLHGIYDNLKERLHLLASGLRTVQPRQRTLRALLDWSYTLLPEDTRCVMRRLGVFQSSFSLEEAASVVADEELSAVAVKQRVVALADRSLLSIDASGDVARYRMLEVTRAYAGELLVESEEHSMLGMRHALMLLDHYERSASDWDVLSRSAWLAQHARFTDDLRSALDWAFGPDGDDEIGVKLVVAVAPLAFELVVLHDLRSRVQQAISVLEQLPGDHRETAARLYTALGSLFNQLLGPSPEMAIAYQRAFDLVPDREDAKAMTPSVVGLWAKDYASGEYAKSAEWAQRLETLAKARDDAIALLIAKRMLAQANHMMGNHETARAFATRVMQYPQGRFPLVYGPSQTSVHVTMRIVLARTDWLEGRADDAAERIGEAVDLAAGEHVIAEYLVLAMAAVPIALWRGDLELARARIDRLHTLMQRYPSPYWQAWADGFDYALRPQGRSPPPYDPLRFENFVTLHRDLWHPRALARVEAGTSNWCAPEVLRVHALRLAGEEPAKAEATLIRALDLAREQGALAWELRCATSLAELWMPNRPGKARTLLRPVVRRLRQGLDTRDVLAALALAEA
ncbi:ATP-binding protein [Roseateles sp.]|uniref:ATP-binding protein n=1 Tax=Roseateles sp. TaxID=1971397 RepID=UPI0039EA27A7